MSDRLIKYFDTWDPMCFIEDGAEQGEYESEALEIRSRYKSDMDGEAVGMLTYKVFVEWFELDPVGFKNACKKRGDEIKAILDQ